MLRLLLWLARLGWPLRLARPFMGIYDPWRPGFREDPYAQYAALRARAPVHFHRLLRVWILTRHADVLAVLRDARFSVRREQSALARRTKLFDSLSPGFSEAIRGNLLMLDPPDHTRIRTLVSKAFTPRRVEQLRPRVEELVADLLDRAAAAGRMDLVADFAHPLPIIVIAELLGVPARDRTLFRDWTAELVVLLDPLQAATRGLARAERAFAEMADYFRRIFAERRLEPRDDLLSALVAARDAGDRLSDDELLSTCGLLLGAGHETTANLIANAVVALLRNPAERKRLGDDLGLMPTAVEEFLRYDSPVQVTDRLAREDLEIGGRRIRAGQLVGLSLGGANRDPEVFPEPDRLDLGRAENRHLSFGQGSHFCLGAPLARLEAQVALRALLERFPDFRGPVDPPAWKDSVVLRGPTALPLTLQSP